MGPVWMFVFMFVASLVPQTAQTDDSKGYKLQSPPLCSTTCQKPWFRPDSFGHFMGLSCRFWLLRRYGWEPQSPPDQYINEQHVRHLKVPSGTGASITHYRAPNCFLKSKLPAISPCGEGFIDIVSVNHRGNHSTPVVLTGLPLKGAFESLTINIG